MTNGTATASLRSAAAREPGHATEDPARRIPSRASDDARRPEHRSKDAGGARAKQASELEARSILPSCARSASNRELRNARSSGGAVPARVPAGRSAGVSRGSTNHSRLRSGARQGPLRRASNPAGAPPGTFSDGAFSENISHAFTAERMNPIRRLAAVGKCWSRPGHHGMQSAAARDLPTVTRNWGTSGVPTHRTLADDDECFPSD
jgi:hypothetical protein